LNGSHHPPVEKFTEFLLTFLAGSSIKKCLMRSPRTTFLKIAFVFSSAAALSCSQAADSQPSSSAPRPGIPEKIEFSGSSSTTPRVPRPGQKDENKELLNKSGNVPDTIVRPELSVHSPGSGSVTMPSKAAVEKMMEKWDKQKNWLVPGAQDKETDEDPFKQLEPQNDPEKKLLSGDKREGVMERFIRGENPKNKTQSDAPNRVRDLDRDRDRSNNRFERADKDRSENKDENEDERPDRNDNSQSNGLAEFDLKRFIRQQDQPNFLNSELPKASQLFRSGNIGNPQTYRDPIADRAKERELDAKRAADFMQLLKPRTSGSALAGTAGINDPINSPDLTRREMNPVLPQMRDSGLGGGSFGAPPPSPASRIQENNLFGVTGPAASSITPTISAPLPRPEPARNRSVVIEPPRRIF
jgi:hypothetical protein